MNTKDILFYNKEGYRINVNYDENLSLYKGSLLFDKNSIDTYKTQGLYIFENIESTNNTFQSYLEKYQIFNTNNFITYPTNLNYDEFLITNIELVNEDVNYNTKWIYADNIHKYFYKGQWCYFTNLNGFHNNDFDEYQTNLQIRKVLAVEFNKILVYTETANNVPLPIFNIVNAKVIGLNIIEVQQSLLNLPAEPSWNETGINTKLYENKKITVISDTEIDGVYTVNKICNDYERFSYTVLNNAFIPIIGDKIKIDIELKTTNILLYSNVVKYGSYINEVGLPVIDTNVIQLSYIPSYLKIGDIIQPKQKITPLNIFNQAQQVITDINYTLKTITVGGTLFTEDIDSYIYLATNIYSIEQDILIDQLGNYNLPLTLWTIYSKHKEQLLNLSGGLRLEYLKETDDLQIISDYTNDYFNVSVYKIDSNNIITPIVLTQQKYIIYPISVAEQISKQLIINKDASIYNKTIEFTFIDDFGLNININGVNYNVDTDITVANTVSDWMTQYSALLLNDGIIVTSPTATSLNITVDYPNIPIFCQLNMGDFSDYIVKYKDVTINNIGIHLLITINGNEFLELFDTDDTTTITNWVNKYFIELKTRGIIVSNTLNVLHFDLLNIEEELIITYNLGYLPKSGDLSIFENLTGTPNAGSIIAGNEIRCLTGTYNFNEFYSPGQKISINGATSKLQNKSYNILNVLEDKINLSYQGVFYQEGLPVININIISDHFIRYPRIGYSDVNNKSKLVFSWKDTQVKDFFFYDFSGSQLKAYTNLFPEYSGPIPLCGNNGEVNLKLIDKPNTELQYVNDPTKQQTVFNIIEHELPFIDETFNNTLEPDPLQVFIGYKADYENWNRCKLYVDLIEDLQYSLTTTYNTGDNKWIFKSNYVEVDTFTTLDFIKLGFVKDQLIEFFGEDINPDNKKLVKLDNAGVVYKIKEVYSKKIVFTRSVIEEESYKQVINQSTPYNTLNRGLNVTIKVMPKTIAYFDVYGESEEEDLRHKINIDNRNLNLLQLKDFYIFKEVDIQDNGIDWIILNRKRKELLEIYPELINSISSYKSVIQAINFFGYNDLTFTEYFQNIDPENKKFGQLMNMDLLNIFDKSIEGWSYSNLAYENLRNKGYRKTNLFTLNYKISDREGNFINSYSLEEVKIKLLGLKRWLTDNIIPIGTKIIDITGKYFTQKNYIINHEVYMNKNYKVLEYGSPVDCDVKGYLQPVNEGSDMYDISIQFKSTDNIEWYKYNIKTFNLHIWNTNLTYLINDIVWYNNKVWIALTNIDINSEPGNNINWLETTIDKIQAVQNIHDYKWDEDNTSITINKLLDPHFIIEIYWHSGYSLTNKTTKTFSVIPNFFDNL